MVTHLSPGTNPYIRACPRAYSIQENHPPIYVADVLLCRHVDPGDKREMFLDLERYRKCLTANFQKHILFRALDMLRSQGLKMAELLKLLAPVSSYPGFQIWDLIPKF